MNLTGLRKRVAAVEESSSPGLAESLRAARERVQSMTPAERERDFEELRQRTAVQREQLRSDGLL